MRPIALLLLLAGGVGVLATFALAFSGNTPSAMQTAGAASSAVILGMVLYRR